MHADAVHPDTRAVLLLCGGFDPYGAAGPKPLTLAEYNRVATWLARQSKRPADLLAAPADFLASGDAELGEGERLGPLLRRGTQLASALERWSALGVWVMSRGEPAYPRRFRRTLGAKAPPLLYGVGDAARLDLGGLAVVGSRDAEEVDLTFTRCVAERCALQGVQVVSGGGRGVDRAAMVGALEAGGSVVGVLADRLGRAAASPDYREAIQVGLLTLVSPYEPESRFLDWKAMERNKHIYSLADFALVVRFTVGRGGTWAGVEEHLRKTSQSGSAAPVFVHEGANPKAGLDQLHEWGARPFPAEEFLGGGVVEVLGRQPGASAEPPAPATPPPTAETCFSRCLPLLIDCFQQERNANDLKALPAQLGLFPAQFKAWLAQAVEEGHIVKRKSSRRAVYVAVGTEAQSSLFRADDAN